MNNDRTVVNSGRKNMKVIIDGVETEVFSQEEADVKAQEATVAERERLQAEHDMEKTTLEQEKADLAEKISKLQDKDHNFQQLRQKNNKDDEEVKSLKTRLDELGGKVSELEVQPFKKLKEDFMTVNNISGDKDTLDKFEFFFKPLVAQAKSEADVQAALTAAFAGATGGQQKPSFEGMMVSTRITPPSSSAGQLTQASVEIGASLGVSAADREKYGKKK